MAALYTVLRLPAMNLAGCTGIEKRTIVDLKGPRRTLQLYDNQRESC